MRILKISIGPLGLTINNALITDKLDAQQTYVAGSIIITDQLGVVIPGAIVTVADDNRSFEITFADGTLNQPVKVTYSTRLNETMIGKYTVKNNIQILGGTGKTALHSVTTATTSSQWSFGGGGKGRTVTFTLNKQHPNGTKIPDATFKLVRVKMNGSLIENQDISGTTVNGVFEIKGARAGRYIVTEESVPEAYEKLTEPIYIIIGYASPEERAAGAGEYIVQVTDSEWSPLGSDIASVNPNSSNALIVNNEVKKGSVTATKNWIGGSNSRPTVHFQLYRQIENGEAEVVP